MQKRSETLLGINIIRKLTFANHIANRCSLVNNTLRAVMKIRRFLLTEQRRYFSEAYAMSAFKCCPLMWMFCNKTSINQINKIHKRALRLVYEMEDAN